MEKDKSIISNSMYYGLIFGGVLVVYNVISTLTGVTEKVMTGGLTMQIMSMLLGMIIYFVGISLSQKNYRVKQLDDVMSYGQALSFGILVSVFASFLVAVYNFIYASWINPDFMQEVYEITKQTTIDMLERFNAPEESFDLALEKIEEEGIQTPIDFAFGAIMNGFIGGVIISLITSIFTKKENKNPFAGVAED